jgi:vacuolar-type H+-ATPase subunit H
VELGDIVERELIILKENERRVLLWASPKAQERVKKAEIRLANAKENLAKAEKELELARKRAEKTSDSILRSQLEQTRKRAHVLLNRLYKKRENLSKKQHDLYSSNKSDSFHVTVQPTRYVKSRVSYGI